mgnify:CR=1 FL=1
MGIASSIRRLLIEILEGKLARIYSANKCHTACAILDPGKGGGLKWNKAELIAMLTGSVDLGKVKENIAKILKEKRNK